ncbi:MAG: class I SAM-dependent methyltransferase [Anaerolineae bacterium]
MNLIEIIDRDPAPLPWAEGDNIPWNDPAFSARMLQEHLSQKHDAASRRGSKIDAHVAWIHEHLLEEKPTRILDLGCGPGLYASRLARLGHSCVGIDWGPASIAYGRRMAAEDGLDCTYVEADIRQADYGQGYGLAMFVYGEFNVFCPPDAARILDKAHAALVDGGILLLEPHTYEAIRREGQSGRQWYTASSGLFSEDPYLYLVEHTWDEDRATCTTRHYIVDAATAEVTRHAASYQAYTDAQYDELLQEHGFSELARSPSLTGAVDEAQRDFFALVARKAAARPLRG